jgi:hypothetical protein
MGYRRFAPLRSALVAVNKNMLAVTNGPVTAPMIPIAVTMNPPIGVIPIVVWMREGRARKMRTRKARVLHSNGSGGRGGRVRWSSQPALQQPTSK